MSGYHAHGSVVSPDHRDTSGEDAWVRRRSLPAIAPWIPQIVKIEGGIPQDALATQLPTTQYAVDEGEILEMQPHNDQPQTSRAHSFLYSIPQWQPQSTQFTGQQPSTGPCRPVSAQSTKPPSFTGHQPSLRSTQPIPAQRTRPPSARLQGLPPPSLASIRQNKLSSPQPQDQPNSYLLTDVGYDENIPGIYCIDVLDKRIGIRPRQKKSPELRELKSRPRTWNAHLPRSMTMIIQQFMVANGYVFPHKNMTSSDFANFRNSLAHRLDLSRKFLATKWERKLIKSVRVSVDAYVVNQSTSWRAQGVFKQVPETARPIFATFTEGWTDRNWDGNTWDSASATMTTRPPVLPVSSSHPSRPVDSEKLGEITRKVTMLDEDTEGPLDTSYEALKPTLKRSSQDDPNNQANKRTCTRDYTPITSKQEYIDHEYEEANDLGNIRPKERGLAVAIEATRHARSTTFNLAPMTAKDLAIMQQDWASDGFPSLLAETLNIGRAYTTSMSKYFDNALDLLSLLRESGHWKAGHMKVQLDCVCQKGEAVPEQLQNGRIPNLSNPLNGEVDVQHLHEQEDTMHDRSQDAKAFDRPILSTGNIKIDRPSHPELAATRPIA